MSQSQEEDYKHLWKMVDILLDKTTTTINDIKNLVDENKLLKEKLKFYLEPFKLRPTYQELEKKLEKIEQLREGWTREEVYEKWKEFNNKFIAILKEKP